MSDDNKNLEPTHKKLEDAREKGQVAVSKDLAHLCGLAVVGELAFLSEPLWRDAVNALFGLSVMHFDQPFKHVLMEMLASAGLLLGLVFGATFVVCIVVAFASFWGQFGILIEPKALEPKFDKLNPVNGFKELFSKKKFSELALTIFKSSLIGLIVFILVRDQLPAIVSLSSGTPMDVYQGFLDLTHFIFRIILVVCVCIGIIDFATQLYFHKKQLMMDMEEVKREFRETEGDPLLKNTRKQLAREFATTDPIAATKDANAVVVNPTHFAVAMLYDPEITSVPVILAKGKDDVAHSMIRCARENGIPVIRHVWLARTLYATGKPNSYVPKPSYEAVAHVYAVVQELVEADQTNREVELERYGEPPPRTGA